MKNHILPVLAVSTVLLSACTPSVDSILDSIGIGSGVSISQTGVQIGDTVINSSGVTMSGMSITSTGISASGMTISKSGVSMSGKTTGSGSSGKSEEDLNAEADEVFQDVQSLFNELDE